MMTPMQMSRAISDLDARVRVLERIVGRPPEAPPTVPPPAASADSTNDAQPPPASE